MDRPRAQSLVRTPVSGSLRTHVAPRVRSIQFADDTAILEFDAQVLGEAGRQAITDSVELQIRLRTKGLMAHSTLVCDRSGLRAFGHALDRINGADSAPARLNGSGDRAPAVALSASQSPGRFALTLLGLSHDQRISFVAQDWPLSEQDFWRIRQWVSELLN